MQALRVKERIEKYDIMALTFAFSFFLILSSSNAGYSISLVLLLCCIIRRNSQWERLRDIVIPPGPIWGVFCIFAVALIGSSLFQPGFTTTRATLKYLYWAFPFIPLFYGYIRGKSEAAFFIGNDLALWVLSFNGWMQIPPFAAARFAMPPGTRVHSFFVSPNGYAQVIEQALPIAILGCVYIYQLVKTSPAKISYRTWLVFQILTVLIAIPPFILALSRGAIAGFILGGALLAAVYAAASFCSYYKRILLILISIVSVGASFYGITRYQESSYSNIQGSSSILKEVGLSAQSIYADSGQIIGDIPFTISHRPYDNQRLLMWEASYAMWQDHKMTGVGFDRWQYEYEHHYISPEAAERTMPMPHNNLAFFFSATGWIGGSGYLVFTLGTLIYLIYAVYNRPRNVVPAIGLWAFAALTVHGQVDTGITNKFVMHIFFGILGIACAVVKYPGNK